MLAVHVWYALNGMTVAREYLHFRFYSAKKTLGASGEGATRSAAFLWARGWALAKGIIGGIVLWLVKWGR
ncbi:MAG: hypothetical protein EBS29_05040 [Chloroflexia bacterium]|nr:hypothetical protein [Chloroflexia bacterium]